MGVVTQRNAMHKHAPMAREVLGAAPSRSRLQNTTRISAANAKKIASLCALAAFKYGATRLCVRSHPPPPTSILASYCAHMHTKSAKFLAGWAF